MGFGDLRGKARVDPRNPQGFGVCDAGGEWRNLRDLHWQFEWSGNKLINLGFRVCAQHRDKPQQQFRTPILPADPYPLFNPRVEFFDVDRGNFGFTELTLQPAILITDPAPGTAQYGVGPYGGGTFGGPVEALKQAVLNAIGAVAHITVPTPLTDFSGTFAQAIATQQILAANPLRKFLLVYNPTNSPMIVSTGAAAFAGDPFAILIGPGNGLLQTIQTLPKGIYAGALTAACYLRGNAFFGWYA